VEEDRKDDGLQQEDEDARMQEVWAYIDQANAKVRRLHRFAEAQGCTPAPNDKVTKMGGFAECRKENPLPLDERAAGKSTTETIVPGNCTG